MKNKEEQTAPKLRFKGYTDAWQQGKLGDLGSVAMNKRIFKHQTTPIGEIPFYKIGTFGKQADSYISHELFEEYKKNYPFPKKGDLLIAASGSIGKIVEYRGEKAYFQDSNIVWLDHNEKVLNSYLKAYYQIIKWSGIEGTTIKRLYNKNILKTKICFPSIKEQKQLGILIQKLEFLITLLQRKKAKYEELKTALLQNLFPEKDSRVPLLRFKEFHNDWQQKKLETITNITMGQSPNGSTYSEIPTKYILVQGNADLKNGWVTPRIWTTQMTKQAKKGDIIFSVRAPVGKVGKTNYDVVIGRGVAAIKGNDFLFNVLKKLDKESYWDKVSSGSTFSSITSSDLKNTKIKIPQEIEQVKIGDLFFNFDETINILQKQLSKFENFKQFLLQNMFI